MDEKSQGGRSQEGKDNDQSKHLARGYAAWWWQTQGLWLQGVWTESLPLDFDVILPNTPSCLITEILSIYYYFSSMSPVDVDLLAASRGRNPDVLADLPKIYSV